MKKMKVTMAVAASALLLSSPAMAFHSGGVAECEGCHSMHNSFEGQANVTGRTLAEASGPYLLKANDQSGSCLNCHEHAGDTGPSSYHISTAEIDMPTGSAPLQRTPGGDFGWLKKDYSFVVRGTTINLHGERNGHNIIAADFGYDADSTLTVAPGGTYPADQLACSSCHDPHGRYRRFADGSVATTGLPISNSGSYNTSADPIANVKAVGVYRILGGIGYQPKSLAGNFAFTQNVPAAVAPSSYNRTESATPTKTIYGQNMSEWCSNCHTGFISNGYTSGMAGLRHPAGNNAPMGAGYPTQIDNNYNAYVTSGIMTGTDSNGAYSSLVPFEFNTADYTVLKAKAGGTDANLSAADNSNVMCLSCHRAHATGFESMLRFFYLNEFMTVADASNQAAYADPTVSAQAAVAQGKTVAETTAAYYDRPASAFGPWARSQCNKCHAKD